MQITELYNYNHRLANTNLLARNLFAIISVILLLIDASPYFHFIAVVSCFIFTVCITGIPVTRLARLYCLPLVFVVLGCITVIISINGSRPVFHLGTIGVGYDAHSIPLAGKALARSISTCGVFYFFILTNSISDIASMMRALRVPPLFVEIFILTYKFIFSVMRVSSAMLDAQRSRGAYSSRRHAYRSLSYLFTGAFSLSLQQAEFTGHGLASRSITGEFLFVNKEHDAHVKEYVWIAVMTTVVVGSFIVVNYLNGQ